MTNFWDQVESTTNTHQLLSSLLLLYSLSHSLTLAARPMMRFSFAYSNDLFINIEFWLSIIMPSLPKLVWVLYCFRVTDWSSFTTFISAPSETMTCSRGLIPSSSSKVTADGYDKERNSMVSKEVGSRLMSSSPAKSSHWLSQARCNGV